MANQRGAEAEAILDRFVETMFRLMVDHHQKHVVELDLTMPQAQALGVLRRGPLCTGELAAVLRISAPAVTQLTNRLTRKQLIERRMADGDRRSVIVMLTDRGRRAVDMFRERRNTIFGGALSHLDDEDRQQVVMALAKVVKALEEYGAEKAVQETADGQSGAADQPVPASNITGPVKPGHGRAKMKMEWD
ncbi:MAG TPA: MarR family transcriptional regulator [Blastocatellia bacterium]|jgi:DNA-binding MarR family transcriptional regulator|nr:MarR family transcriptional regulator [Blastocatellia bacterium]